jgi:hypothetical protein
VSGLSVYLNREGLNTVETDRSVVQATESVRVVLENHGKPTHVHLRLDDDLATLGTIEDPHWFVPADEARTVPIRLTDGAEGRGRLEITAGYGQSTTKVDVEVGPSDDPPTQAVEADDSTVTPDRETSEGRPTVRSVEPTLAPIEGLDLGPWTLLAGSGAVLLVVGLLVLANPVVALSAGLVAVLSGIAVASYLGAGPEQSEPP